MLSSKEVYHRQMTQQGYCPECRNTTFVTDRESGEITCYSCGLVLQEELLDHKPEWRAFTPEERRSKVRVGAPTSLKQFDKGLSTTFQPYRDPYGKALPMKERLKMMRLRKWNIRARMHSSTERNLSQAMHELTRLSDRLHIPQAVEENAALIYRKALERGLIRGRSIRSIAAASLYAACRLTRTPRSLKEIVESSPRDRKEIARCYRLIQRSLNVNMPVDDPLKYISKIASKSRLDQKTQNLAIELLQQAKQINGLVGKGPTGIAAAALYIASIMNGKTVTQRELAKAADVTEVTVRNRYKGLDTTLHLGLRSSRY